MSSRFAVMGAVALLFGVHASGQGGPTLIDSGYYAPAVVVAPGQVVTFEVAGLKTVLSPNSVKASSLPLPTELAGISVTVNQTIRQSIMGTPVQTAHRAPILAVTQSTLCLDGAPSDCLLTFLTVQIPYEIATSAAVPPFVETQIIISESGTDSKAFPAGAVSDRIHVVTICDGFTKVPGCLSVVAHADGTPVTLGAPAVAGEVVIIYAWGLGHTNPAVVTGDASPKQPALVSLPGFSGGPLVRFDFSPNAAPSDYFPTASSANAYLTPGFAGLYQINVGLPSSFPPVVPCGQGVRSNLTVNLRGPFSFDGAAICVQPQ